MRLVEKLADNLAKDAIELANKLGNDDVIYERTVDFHKIWLNSIS